MNARRWRYLGPVAWAVALIGYLGPWLDHRAAALAWNAYDMFAILRLLPEIETGAVAVNMQALRLPLVALAVLLPVLAAPLARGWRWASALLGVALLALTLPPYPEIVGAWSRPGWRVPFWWGVGGMAATVALIWLAPASAWLRSWGVLGWLLLTGAPAGITLLRLLPALANLHATSVRPGWGAGVFLVGWVGLGLWVWLPVVLPERRGDDGSERK